MGTYFLQKTSGTAWAPIVPNVNKTDCDLSGYWRLIYTLKQPQRENPEIEVLSIWLDVLDILDHPKYDKIFGYRKK